MMEEKTKFEDDTDISSSENEDEKDNFSQTDRNVLKDVGDPEVKSLHGKHKNGRLNIQPDFQRHFIWDEKKSSRLMESALLGIPLPVVYLSQDNDGKVSVIDGQQRLTSFFNFIDGRFKLSSLNVFDELNGKNLTK